MRELPAPGQKARFLGSADQRPGVYHHVRLTGALILTGMGAWTAVSVGLPPRLETALPALAGALLALSSLAYLAGTFLPFSRSRPRMWLRRYALLGDRVLLRVLLRHARLVGDKTDPILRSFVRANNAAVL
ncbi:MAG: hypothetical protein ACE5ID_07900, partial [Acidobacteriota bacterium]